MPHKNLKGPGPSIGLWIVGLAMAPLMGGCAFSALATIVGRITAAKSPSQLAPSWPTDDTVALLDQSIAFGDPKIMGSLATGALKGEIATSSTGIATISPAPIPIPTISLGANLDLPNSTSVSIASVSIGIPVTSSTVPSTTVTFAQTPAANQTFSFPGINGGSPITISQAKTLVNLCNCNPGLPNSASLNTSASSTQPLADVQDVHVTSGTIQVPMDNETAGTLTIQMTITDGASQSLGTQTQALAPHTAATSSFSLAGKLITSPINTAATITGSIAQGTPISQIDPTNDHITIGPSAFSMSPDYGDIHVTAQQGSNPTGTGYNAALTPITQTFPVTSGLPATSGLKNLSSVTVASGSLTVTLDNALAVDGNVGLSFNGISNVTSAQVASNPSLPPIPAQSGVLTLPVNAGTTSVFVVPLAGAVISPDASGNVSAIITPSTLDTDADRTHPDPHANPHNFVHVTTGDSLAGNVTLSPLAFKDVVGSLTTAQTIATSTVPLSLPPQFSQTGISPAAISVSVLVNNQSQLSGVFTPAIIGLTPGGSQIPLVFSASASPPFSGAFLGASTSGATQSTTLVINQKNSNILQLLQDGVSSLQIGGTVQVQANNATVSNADQIGGQVTVAIPLSIVVPAFGPGDTNPAIDIQPPSPLSLSASTISKLQQVVQSVELDTRIDNGWQFPLTVNILISTSSDPYSDPNAIVRTLTLGSGPTAVSSLALDPQQIAELPNLKTIGFQITSSGTGGQAISILPTDTLHVQISAHITGEVSSRLMSLGKP